MPNRLTITNPKGATLRTAPNTSGGILRPAKAGTVLDYVATIPYANGDVWAMLTQTDPITQRPWRYGKDEAAVFVAVYVGGVEYATLQPDTADGYNAALMDAIEAIGKLKR
jgi:hypothetical protein